MEKMDFVVEGMTCQHCVAAVKKVLQDVSGVQTVAVDLDSKSAEVTGVSLNPDHLLAAIEAEGYTAQRRYCAPDKSMNYNKSPSEI